MILDAPFSHLAAIGFLILMPALAAADDRELAAENFQQADFDGDGQLVYAEFATFIDLNAEDGLGRAAMISSRGMHARAFERVDANRDGIVTPEEMQGLR